MSAKKLSNPVVAIVGATAFAVDATSPDVRWPMAIAGTLAGVFMVVRGFAAEFHPWNRAARTLREKLRVTGLIILVTSMLSLALAAIAATAVAAEMLPSTRLVPTAAQMLHVPTLLLGGLAGGTVFTLMMYLNFASVVKISTENLTAMMAFSPATAWLFQEIGDAFGLIKAPTPEPPIVAARPGEHVNDLGQPSRRRSLFERMTGVSRPREPGSERGPAMPREPIEPRLHGNAAPRAETAAQKAIAENPPARAQQEHAPPKAAQPPSEEEVLDIPAFLRRQAN